MTEYDIPDLSGYRGEWVWVCDGRIIAHDKDRIPDIGGHRAQCKKIPTLIPVPRYNNFIGTVI